MIGFDSIGTMGRLGNQMFQHAAVKGIARKHGYEYAIYHQKILTHRLIIMDC